MNDLNLKNFINSVVEHILVNEAEEYLEQLDYIFIGDVNISRVGFYANFRHPDEYRAKIIENLTLGSSIHAEVLGLKYGVDFMLYVDGGIITMLEGFTVDGDNYWPSEIVDFKLTLT
ncbi:hypothetical protein [Vibrio navarrensis]|uniref:Uncharacterized protein n=1 Tax=Vibrio navarrensis TaxID=29495 RepID=A0A099MKJ5_9VIBR|nr:hypothetical protein [Vibrio navarrensis]KGK10064.1 hypothetical protein EA26_01550 [Vibrio navarrensis]KGK20384.1 hypothetical protein EA25_16060 [Vibrio navarrensis]MBE4582505.1 hypothetical protein [Vibrio navarrensis]MBE4615440.1 hypothetical protein [Vibrio navarrensis]QOD69945.1 hypothetical protein IF132_14470 [Vibrio navarrensis]